MSRQPLSDPSVDRYVDQLEKEAVRAALPRGLMDARGEELKRELNWCLTKNDWYFTTAGVVLGGLLSWMAGSAKPFAIAVLVAPGLDWANSRHLCAELEEAYKAHKKHLMEEYKKQAEEIKEQIRAGYR